MAKHDKYCTPEELAERKKKRAERAKRDAEWAKRRGEWAAKAASNKAHAKKRGGKVKPASNAHSEVTQHFERKAKMDKKNIPMCRRVYKISPALLIQFLKAGFKTREIAQLLDVAETTIRRKIRKYNLDLELLRAYEKNKADVLAGLQMRIIDSITDEKLEKATLRDSATSFTAFNNAERLERGSSTANVDVGIANKTFAELQAQEERMLAELKALTGGSITLDEEAEEAEIVKKESAEDEE